MTKVPTNQFPTNPYHTLPVWMEANAKRAFEAAQQAEAAKRAAEDALCQKRTVLDGPPR